MKKLSKVHLNNRDIVTAALRETLQTFTEAVGEYNTEEQEAFEVLQTAITAYNERMVEAWEKVETAQTAHNESIDAANEWMGQIVSDIDEYMSGKSEKWQDGDAAQAYSEWKAAFEEDLEQEDMEQPEQIEIEQPDELSLNSDEDPADKLEQLPEELG
jgi:hypothetical protein